MSRAAPLALALIAAALGGCDPIMQLGGVVKTVPPERGRTATGNVYAGAEPIAGAVVEYICPEGEPHQFAVSDESGRLQKATIGLWRTDCELRVEKPGYHPQRFSIDDLCLLRSGGDCHFIALYAELVPKREPATAAE